MSRPLSTALPDVGARLLNSDHVFLALDFDGTLAPVSDSPEDAVLPPGTGRVLRGLAASERVSVAILSGRSIIDLKRKIGLDVIYAGNHGLEIEGPGVSFVHDGARMLREFTDHACWDLEATLQNIRGVFVERKGLTATVHYRQAPAHLDTWIEAAVRLTTRPYRPWLTLRPALKAWEICPRLGWNKGCALKFLVDRLRAARPALVCAGDDATDEDMFRLFPDAISIKIGGALPTWARYHVDGPGELLVFLELIPAASLTSPKWPG